MANKEKPKTMDDVAMSFVDEPGKPAATEETKRPKNNQFSVTIQKF
jgi:hypothetical protein